MMDEPIFDLDAAEPNRWRVDICNHFEPIHPTRSFGPLAEVSFEATMEIDADAYERVIGAMPAPSYTVQYAIDHNPWHRTAQGVRARLRKVRDGIWWTVQRRVLRRSLVEQTTITIPNCSITSE